MANFTTDFNVGDAVEYIDPESGWHHAGVVLAVDFGSGWSEVRVQVQWEDMRPTWVANNLLRSLDDGPINDSEYFMGSYGDSA